MIPHGDRGFTLIEIVLVVALISIVAGAGLRLPYLFSPQKVGEADVFSVVTMLYRAQTLAATGRADGEWGVLVADGIVTLFNGDSFAARDTQYDETTQFESDVVLSGASEIIFNAHAAVPQSAATISLQFDYGLATIVVSDAGVIDYDYAD